MKTSSFTLICFVCFALDLTDPLPFASAYGSQADQRCGSDEQGYCDANQIGESKSFVSRNNYSTPSESCFRAAVFEFNRKDLDTCKETSKRSLDIFEKVAGIASNDGAKIIVFPEDGVFWGERAYVAPCLEDLSQPNVILGENNDQCNKLNLEDQNYVLKRLSCIAKTFSIYVVANYGTRENCSPSKRIGRATCPDDGYLRLNTNVVLDPNGRFITKYRKFNSYIEIFDLTPELEQVYFDTKFGRFGLFTCFDILFKQPAVDLVEQFEIDTVLFPTWWYDELPILSAVQFQDGWSAAMNVNFLAANILRPKLGSTGTAIFSRENSAYVATDSYKSRLILATVESSLKSVPKCSSEFNPKIVEVDTEEPEESYKYKNYEILPTDSIVKLDKISDKKTVCAGRFCCSIDYQLLDVGDKKSSFDNIVVIVRSSKRPGLFKWFEQVCALATLLRSPKLDTKEQNEDLKPNSNFLYSKEAAASFVHLSLEATFDTKYVYPFGGHNVTNLIDRRRRNLNCDNQSSISLAAGSGADEKHKVRCRFALIPSIDSEPAPVYSFGMYGRVYEDDANIWLEL